jgi:hypothetical protein
VRSKFRQGVSSHSSRLDLRAREYDERMCGSLGVDVILVMLCGIES